MPTKPPKKKRGRPSLGISEAQTYLRLPSALDALVREAAKQDGVTVAEWWRAAAVLALRMRAQS